MKWLALVFGLMLCTTSAEAAGTVSLSGKTVGQVVTMTAQINPNSCGGGLPDEEIKSIGIVVYEARTPRGNGPYVDTAGATVNVIVEGKTIGGRVVNRTSNQDVYLEFVPSTNLIMSERYSAKVVVSGLKILRAGKAELQVIMVQQSGNQCFGSDTAYVNLVTGETPTMKPTATATITPTEVQIIKVVDQAPSTELKHDSGEIWWRKLLRWFRLVK